MKLIVVLAQAFPKNIESKIKLYNNLLFSHQGVRKTIGGRWVKEKASGNWMQWSSRDDGWMKRDWMIKREDWGRKKSIGFIAKRLLAGAISSTKERA